MNIFIRLAIAIVLISASTLVAQQFRLVRPVPDNVQTNGSYLFGEPSISSPGNAHRGIDISIQYDTVYSASNGVVYATANQPSGAGLYIVVKSEWNGRFIYIYYMHLDSFYVATNDLVLAGQPIALSGNTGFSTGPHLHFEIRMDSPSSTSRKTRNPELWCAITGMGAIYGRVPNAANNTRVDISPNPKPRPPYTTFTYGLTYNFTDPYVGSDEIYNENYAIGDVKPGTYLITSTGGYSRTVTVGAGQVVNADAPTSVEESVIVDNFKLHQNYPNPFNPTTSIRFQLPERSYVQLKVYDVLGKEVGVLIDGERSRGTYDEFFDAGNMASGVYIYTILVKSIESGKSYRENKKMMLMK